MESLILSSSNWSVDAFSLLWNILEEKSPKPGLDAKRPNLQAEIAKNAKEHEKVANEIAEGKKEFDAKKPELFKEIKKKVEEKK